MIELQLDHHIFLIYLTTVHCLFSSADWTSVSQGINASPMSFITKLLFDEGIYALFGMCISVCALVRVCRQIVFQYP